MGNLIKTDLARLITLTAAVYQVWAALWGYAYPKAFFDMLTPIFDLAVKPIPVLQTINFILGLATIAVEYPNRHDLNSAAWSSLSPYWPRSMIAKAVAYMLFVLPCILMYQTTNPAIYYFIAASVWAWGWASGEEGLLARDVMKGEKGGEKA
ncbi:hypothetical protein G7K_5175-t1 [Saitoella complicata NRRL Y-17804]|uniref:DUF7727 domain-containing protein n=2 Tax=Saitoella complicata (strain BCRC 22490 / CBS 7301 / JCM 7358 / NBRC 10748 / NRRL Y-17804) TaxID=698492 RepID=A0A0E9NMN7_SAICN|nr:hypothetical protein G7K_5175-t1 [Saitoella complicata NRRL Y-17804]